MATAQPVVRVPGYSRDELRDIDRQAKLWRLSRAAWIRLVTLSVAQGRTQVNLTRERVLDVPKATVASNGGVSASLVKSFDPDAP